MRFLRRSRLAQALGLSLLAISNGEAASRFVLVSQSGDCTGMEFRILDSLSGAILTQREAVPCQTLSLNEGPTVLAEQVARRIGIPEAPSRYSLRSRSGDCTGMTFDIRNDSTGVAYSYRSARPCEEINFHGDGKPDAVAAQVAFKLGLSVDRPRPFKLIEQKGDCGGMAFTVMNVLDGRMGAFRTSTPCQSIDFHKGRRPELVALEVARLLGIAPSTDLYLDCDAIAVPSTISARLGGLAVGTRERPSRVCLKPGSYGPLKLAGIRNARLTAPEGNVSFIASVSGSLSSAVVEISDSENVTLEGISIANTYQFQGTQLEQVSRALGLSRSQGIRLMNVSVKSRGKQTIYAANSELRLYDSEVSCYYFCLDMRYSTLLAEKTRFVADHETLPGDTHSLLWTDHSSQGFLDCSFAARSGKGLIAGVNDPQKQLISVQGVTSVAESLEAWVQKHPNYSGIRLYFTGSLPAIKDFYFNAYAGGGDSVGTSVCRRPGTETAYTCN
ncbi:MAG: hypothetical protein NDJ89_13415 [Oligoflexia bacterium]|nr:hypothetical protein [Oligoflexia bacterium]